jgi:hypothetical protein
MAISSRIVLCKLPNYHANLEARKRGLPQRSFANLSLSLVYQEDKGLDEQSGELYRIGPLASIVLL